MRKSKLNSITKDVLKLCSKHKISLLTLKKTLDTTNKTSKMDEEVEIEGKDFWGSVGKLVRRVTKRNKERK